jgi:pimeloyl-ACP methyl ester carboxylesterase
MDVPANWNKKLLLYSHGYVLPGSPNPAYDYGDGNSAYYLYLKGYAFAGSSYASTGWAVQQAIPDQIATLGVFESAVGTPTETIAWGSSLGGLITAGLIQQYPNVFSGGLPMCGVVAGGVGFWNEALDVAFVFNTLVAGGTLQVVDIADPLQNYDSAESFLGAAQGTAQGRARVALTAAMADVPGWFNPHAPAPGNYTTQEVNQFKWFAGADFLFPFYLRSELESRAGGNPSFNTSVDYATQLSFSVDNQEVQALYAAAGLSLDADLATLSQAARISSDPGALTYLSDNIIYNGQLAVPVLTLHTVGDGLVPVQDESAYLQVAEEAGDSTMLQQLFVNRAGHCEFTSAEIIVALESLDQRINTGQWPNLNPATLNSEGTALGPVYSFLGSDSTVDVTPPAFLDYQPLEFLRVYDFYTQ